MAPAKQRKISQFQTAEGFAPASLRSPSPARTPEQEGIAANVQAHITRAQKEALIENLKLETAERIRKLQATAELHAANMRSRLEIRVNRVPTATRAMTIQELLERHEKATAPAPSTAAKKARVTAQKATAPAPTTARQPRTAAPKAIAPEPATNPQPIKPSRGKKRASDAISDNKENVPELIIPKKRARVAPTADPQPSKPRATRAPSRKVNAEPAQILSPRSHNSRTAPKPARKPSETVAQSKTRTRTKPAAQGSSTATSRTNPIGRILRSRK